MNHERRIATDALPYPVARAVRAYEIALDPWRRYDQALVAAENLIYWLGVLGLAWLSERDEAPPHDQWANALASSGITVGTWLDLVFSIEKSMAGGAGLQGYSEALRPRKGNAGLRGALEKLVAERNDRAHGRGPRTEGELEDRLKEISPLIEEAAEGASFLKDLVAVIPHRSNFSHRRADFTVTALALVGEHPDFEPSVFVSSVPLAEQHVYVLREDSPLILSPFCIARDCPECRRRELFIPERFEDGKFVLKSLDEGHILSGSDLLSELPKWIWATQQLAPDSDHPSEVALAISDEKQGEDLERTFHKEMVRVYEEAKEEAGYTAPRFLQLISERGGLGAARHLLHSTGVADGFTALWERGRLDLSMEARVLKPEYESLFSEEEREIARKRLEDYGYRGGDR